MRRTRVGGAWQDYNDVPLSETTEAYVVQIWDSSYTLCARIIQVAAAQSTIYTSAQQVTDFGAQQQTIYWSVGQVGSFSFGSQSFSAAPGAGGSNVAPLAPIAPYVYVPNIPPPGPTAAVNYVATWPAWSKQISNYVGDRIVIQFTTGGTVPLTGTFNIVEAVAAPAYRHSFIATDTGGTNIIANSTSYGVSVTSFLGAASGGAILASGTTYYFIFDYRMPDGTLSQTPGQWAQCLVTLANVT
jgi:hypothetical protein